MGKKYIVKVNGKVYEVEVEEVGSTVSTNELKESKESKVVPSQSLTQPVSTQRVETSSSQSSISSSSEERKEEKEEGNVERVVAPMSGVVLKINVHPGDVVKDAQTLMIIEAMKMENEILAPRDGRIKEIFVKEGQQIEIDQVLLTIE